MSEEATAYQFFNDIPPRDTQCVALTATATAASLDLRTLNLFSAYNVARKDMVFVTLIADGGDIYVSFSGAGVTINPATVGQATTGAFLLPQSMPFSFRIAKQVDFFINYAARTTGTLRMYASSHLSQQGVGST